MFTLNCTFLEVRNWFTLLCSLPTIFKLIFLNCCFCHMTSSLKTYHDGFVSSHNAIRCTRLTLCYKQLENKTNYIKQLFPDINRHHRTMTPGKQHEWGEHCCSRDFLPLHTHSGLWYTRLIHLVKLSREQSSRKLKWLKIVGPSLE